jgi:hypothetical protein
MLALLRVASTIDPMLIILLFLVIAAILILIKLQRTKDNFDLRSVITDSKGQPSIHKVGQLTALLLSTWLLAYLAIHHQMTGEYFGTYMGIWAAAQAADKFMSTRADRIPDDPSNNTEGDQSGMR